MCSCILPFVLLFDKTLSHTLPKLPPSLSPSHPPSLSLSLSLSLQRLSRTQKMGRVHKHIADLYLLSGQLQPACDHFGHALAHLSRDPLWEGSANEGLGATLIMKPKHDELQGQKSADLSIPSNVFGFFKVPQRMLKASVSGRETLSLSAWSVVNMHLCLKPKAARVLCTYAAL